MIRRYVFILFICLLSLVSVGAGLYASEFDAAKSDAKALLNRSDFVLGNLQNLEATQDLNAAAPPQHELNETIKLRDAGVGIEDVARQQLPQSEVGSFLQDSAATRPKFEFDVENDPMFINAANVEANAETIAGLVTSEYQDCQIQTVQLAPAATATATCTEWPVANSGTCTRNLHVSCTTSIQPAQLSNLQGHGGNNFPVSMNATTGLLVLGSSSDNYWRDGIHTRSATFDIEDVTKLVQFDLVFVHYDDYLQIKVNGEQVFHSHGGDTLRFVSITTTLNPDDCPPWGCQQITCSAYSMSTAHPDPSECVSDGWIGGYFYPCTGCMIRDNGNNSRNLNIDLIPFLQSGSNTIEVNTFVVSRGESRAHFIARQNNYICTDQWLQSGQCGYLQELADAGFCSQSNPPDICIEGAETRDISGVPVERSCWKYQKTYECFQGQTNASSCDELRAEGCSQTGSACTDFAPNGTCLAREQTFSCPVGEPVTQEIMNCGGGSNFCLDGSCSDTDYAPSTDLAKAASWLGLMEDMGEDLDPDNFSVFTGQVLRCDDKRVFNCCKNPGSILTVDMDRFCTREDEPILAQRRKAGQCHRVGERCSERHLGICMRKTQSWCCFSGKLGRILQQQGRQQLGIGWGTASNPVCRGFTQEELERLDWSQIDLSEFFADAMENLSLPDVDAQSDDLKQRVQGLLP